MIYVLKADKTKEPFSEEKVLHSIRRARIPENLQAQTLAYIKSKLYNGISTEEIYQYILSFLYESDQPYRKAQYSLKESIMMLGPSGYPFEDFVAKVLDFYGYETAIRQTLQGKCVTHEIDVLATKEGKSVIIEAKFHNSPGTRSDVQTALYTYARYLDCKERNDLSEVWLVTNTKTTLDANTYASCVGMKVLSWNYPAKESLRGMIEESRLYPITVLTSLAQSHKITLLNNHTVLCNDVQKDHGLLDVLPLSSAEKEKVLTEISVILEG